MGEVEKTRQPNSPLPLTPETFSRRKLILQPDEGISMPEVTEFKATPYPGRLAPQREPPATPYEGPRPNEPDIGPEVHQPALEGPGVVLSARLNEPDAPLPASKGAGALPSISISTPSGSTTKLPEKKPARIHKEPIVVVEQPKNIHKPNDLANLGSDRISRGDISAELPTLNNSEYWMNPSIEELRSYSSEDLAHVEHLTVGRTGFGQVEFLEPVDVRGLDLNKLIIIDKLVITVFPDDANKPPRGQGLNVPARITIEQAWPTKRDEKGLASYAAFLKKMGNRRKQRFVAYDKERGAWVFDVPGF